MPDQMKPFVHTPTPLIRPKPGHRLIFSYDLMMDESVMRERCPDPRFICVGRYLSHRLIWNEDGKVSMVPRRDFTVHGVIWEISEVAQTGLDLQLGVPNPFDRYGALVRGPNNELASVEYYSARNHRHGVAEPVALGRLIEVAKRLNFTADYIGELMDWCSGPTAVERQ